MRFFLIAIGLFINSFGLFGQQAVKIQLVDGSTCKGFIHEYNETAFKIILRNNSIVNVPKSDIVAPKVLINPKYFVTTIISNNDNQYQGKVIIENDTIVMLKLGTQSIITLNKSDIAIRHNRSITRRKMIETSIYTKDNNEFVGEVMDKNKDYTMIRLGNHQPPQKIKNQNISTTTEKYRTRQTTARKALRTIGIIYAIPYFISLALFF